jgi:hypothetical protein
MGAFEIPLFKWTLPAGADLSASQYRGLVASGANTIVAGAGVRVIGALQNKPTSGQAAEIQTYGITFAELGGTVTAGADVSMDSAGRFVVSSGSAAILGSCLVGGAVGDIGSVLLGTGVVADPRSAFIQIQDIDVSSGTSFWVIAPVAGNIARVRSIVTTVLAGAAEPAALALELATVLVVGSAVVVAAEAAVGVVDDSGAITPGGTTLVAAGDPIEITTDSVPTSGAVSLLIEIVPS